MEAFQDMFEYRRRLSSSQGPHQYHATLILIPKMICSAMEQNTGDGVAPLGPVECICHGDAPFPMQSGSSHQIHGCVIVTGGTIILIYHFRVVLN